MPVITPKNAATKNPRQTKPSGFQCVGSIPARRDIIAIPLFPRRCVPTRQVPSPRRAQAVDLPTNTTPGAQRKIAFSGELLDPPGAPDMEIDRPMSRSNPDLEELRRRLLESAELMESLVRDR